jgi:lantibiotic modifying enzyme
MNLYPLTRRVGAEDLIAGAEAAAEYIRGLARKSEEGVYWQTKAEALKNCPPMLDLYDGSAGIVLFFLQLAGLTGNRSYLADAAAGARYMVNQFKKTDYAYIPNSGRNFGGKNGCAWGLYYGGLAGIAFALLRAGKTLGDRELEEAAFRITEKIAAAAKKTTHGVIWSGFSSITMDGGTILFLLELSDYFKKPAWKDLAIQGAYAIAATALGVNENHIRFQGVLNPLANHSAFPAFADLGIGGDSFFPDFGYGTAGMCYTLAKAADAAGDAALLAAAEKGARYVMSLAVPTGKGKLLPYIYPDTQRLYYLGFCHGPVGTARLYVLLHQLTGKALYKDFYLALTEGIIEAGAPEHHSAGFWHTHCACCGTAGFINLFLGVWLETGEARYLEYANRSAKVIIGDAAYNGREAVWHQAFSRLDPAVITADIGYYNGASGIAASLVQTAMALQGSFETLRLPDEPYKERR